MKNVEYGQRETFGSFATRLARLSQNCACPAPKTPARNARVLSRGSSRLGLPHHSATAEDSVAADVVAFCRLV